MITQQLYARTLDMTGTLTIKAAAPNLGELYSLMKELALRANVHTEGMVLEGPNVLEPETPPNEE